MGLLDFQEELSDNITDLSKVTERMGSATTKVAEEIRIQTNELNELKENPLPNFQGKFRSIINHAAYHMNRYSGLMDVEIPLFINHLDTVMTIFTRVILWYSAWDDKNDDIMPTMKSSVEELQSGLVNAEVGLEGFRASVSNLPPMTRELNRAKKKTIDVLQRVLDEIQGAKLKLGEIESFME